MGGKRQKLIDIAELLRLTPILRKVHDRGRSSLVILAYHRVMPVDLPDTYPFDLDLISATPGEFAWQMEYLARHCQPVSLAQIVAHMDAGEPLPEGAVAVTFDDGFVDTHLHAFPVLKRLQIPATVFVTTDYIESGEPFWFELAAYLMMHIEPGAIRVEESRQSFPFGPTNTERRASIRRIHQILKVLPNGRRAAMIHDWSSRFSEGLDALISELSRPLNWRQIREMAEQGIEFGSHTLSHPNLTRLADTDLARELTESRRILEQRIERKVEALGYPIGTAEAYDERVMQAAAKSGYRLAVTYVPGVNWQAAGHRYELRRQGISRDMSRSYFRGLVNLPEWIS